MKALSRKGNLYLDAVDPNGIRAAVVQIKFQFPEFVFVLKKLFGCHSVETPLRKVRATIACCLETQEKPGYNRLKVVAVGLCLFNRCKNISNRNRYLIHILSPFITYN